MTSPGLTTEHIRGAYPLWNVWLYTHGLGALAMFVGGTAKDFGIRWKPEPGTWQNIFTWILWGLLLIADLAALAMRWDLQKRLKAKGHRVSLNDDTSPPPPGPSTA